MSGNINSNMTPSSPGGVSDPTNAAQTSNGTNINAASATNATGRGSFDQISSKTLMGNVQMDIQVPPVGHPELPNPSSDSLSYTKMLNSSDVMGNNYAANAQKNLAEPLQQQFNAMAALIAQTASQERDIPVSTLLNKFGFSTSVVNNAPQMMSIPTEQVAKEAAQQPLNTMLSQLLNIGQPKPDVNTLFEQNLQQYAMTNQLSSDEVSQLRALFQNQNAPGTQQTVPPKLATIFQQLQTKTNEEFTQATQNPLNGSVSTPLTTTKGLDQTINQTFDKTFENELLQYAQKNNLPTNVVSQLRTLYYAQNQTPNTPNLIKPPSPDIQNMFKQVLSQTTNLVKQELGLPDNFVPTPNLGKFQAEINGSFRQAVLQQLQQTTPPLSGEQISQAMESLSDPTATLPPDLAKALANASQTATQQVQQHYQLPSDWKPTIDSGTYSNNNVFINQSYQQTFQQNVQNFQPPLSSDDQQALIDAMNNPSAELPPALMSTFKAVQEKSIEQTQQQFGLPSVWTPSDIPQLMDPTLMTDLMTQIMPEASENVSDSFYNAFVKEAKKLAKPEDLKKLLFAQYHPEEIEKLPPALKELLQQINTAVRAQFPSLASNFLYSGSNPVDIEITASYDTNFEAAVAKYAKDNQLSPKESAKLLAMYYMPNAEFPDTEKLQPILNQLEAQVKGDLQKDYGFPPAYQLLSDNTWFQNSIQGTYQHQFMNLVSKVQPPLSSEDANALLAAFGNPSAKLPTNLQQIFSQLNVTAANAVIEEFQLPPNTIINMNPLNAISRNPGVAAMFNGVNQAQQMVKAMSDTAAEKPSTPETIRLIDYLQNVTNAIKRLTQFLYNMEASNADIAGRLNKTSLDIQLNKLEKERVQLEDIRKQEEANKGKGGFLGFVMKVINIVLIIIAAVILTALLCFTGPLVLAIWAAAALMIADALDDGKVMKNVMKSVDDIVQKMPIIPDKFKSAVSMFAKSVIVVTLTALTLGTGFPSAFQASRIVQDLVKALGGSVILQEVIAAVIQIVVQLVIMITLAIIFAIATGGAGAEVSIAMVMSALAEVLPTSVVTAGTTVAAAVTESIAAITQMAANLTAAVINTAKTISVTLGRIVETCIEIMKVIMNLAKSFLKALADNAVSLSMTAVSVAKQASSIKQSLNMADLVMLKAQLEAFLAEKDAIIALIKKALQALLEALTGTAEWVNNVNQMTNQWWADRSQMMTQLASAASGGQA